MPLPTLTTHDVSIATILLRQHDIDPNADTAYPALIALTQAYLIDHEHVLYPAAVLRARLATAIVIRNLGTQPGDPSTQGSVADFAAAAGGHIPIVGEYVGPAAGAAVTTAETVAHGAESAAKAGLSTAEFLGKLADPTTWIRGVYIVGGSLLVLGGIFIVARELGAPNVPRPESLITKPAKFVFKKRSRKVVSA